MRNKLRRALGHDPALVLERDDLAAKVRELLAENERLTELVRRGEQQAADLRKARRDVMIEAYEPVEVGTCRKVRYLHSSDAEEHAIGVAYKNWGDWFSVYQCKICPAYPGEGIRPWHVGHAWTQKHGLLFVDQWVIHYQCGCRYAYNTRELVWGCASHPHWYAG
jgi:hypothetical protein